MTILAAGLILFLGIHLVPAVPPARARIAATWGENRYKGAFAAISALGLVLIVAGYALSGDIDKPALARLANTVYKQLEP